MNVVITGSLGNISKPLTQELVQEGYRVTVISSNAGKKGDIEALGARAAIGKLEDVGFLTSTFKGADVVYAMEPPVNYVDRNIDLIRTYSDLAHNYVTAIRQSGVTKIVHLSSIGAHTGKGNGILAFHYEVENIFRQLPDNVAIKFMRPVGFYYNMFGFVRAIKTAGAIVQNYGGDEKEPWVSPVDIAAVIAEEIGKPFEGRTVRYIASDELSPNEVAKILGEAIGKPDLKWLAVPDEQFLNSLLAAGINPQAAKGLTEMNAGRKSVLYEDYNRHRPVLGKVKLTDFAKEFAAAYHRN